MARFWKRSEDRVERLLRADRRVPRDDFASSILDRISASAAPKRVGSPRRLGLGLALAIASLALIAALGGVTVASAGLGGIFQVASKATTHTTSTTSNKKDSDEKGSKGSKGDDPDGDADDKKKDDDDDDDGHDGDHHQYKVGICHRSEHGTKFKLIFVSPNAVPAHLRHGDHLPVNGKC